MSEKEKIKTAVRKGLAKTVIVLVKLIEMKEPHTEGHSEKVSRWSKIIARKLALSEKSQKEIELAARLHDIGKISIPNRILKKPDRSGKEKYAEVKKHPSLGLPEVDQKSSREGVIATLKRQMLN